MSISPLLNSAARLIAYPNCLSDLSFHNDSNSTLYKLVSSFNLWYLSSNADIEYKLSAFLNLLSFLDSFVSSFLASFDSSLSCLIVLSYAIPDNINSLSLSLNVLSVSNLLK